MKSRALLAGLAAAGLVVTLSGCTLANAITPPVSAQLYPTAADGKASNASIPLPSWVPDDATMIRIKSNTETGDTIMQFTAAAQTIGAPCDASIAGNLPPMQDTWWHQVLPPAEQIVCQDGWHIFISGTSEWNAWKP
ncbi:hypothetical protein [Herbiconiux solani]|uniref:hypothetical protein n=1 Tax=Herbiconiux solani TaxID=661329 RepID=UPI0008256EF3|nr:hypothetical protein [Herbiconiux solani]